MRFGMGELGLGQTFAQQATPCVVGGIDSDGNTIANCGTDESTPNSNVNNSADLANLLAGGAGGSSVCPCAKCSIVPGSCDTTIYLAIAAVAVMFGLAVAGK